MRQRCGVRAVACLWAQATLYLSVACDVCHAGKKVDATVSAPGEFGHGAFKNEPWGLQSYEKRVYAVREFYKATLRGETADNPADDE